MAIFVFKSKKQMKTNERLFHIFVYIKIENDKLLIKSDLTNFKYEELNKLVLTRNKKEIKTLIEFNKIFKNMNNTERKNYLEKEFNEMGYTLIAAFD